MQPKLAHGPRVPVGCLSAKIIPSCMYICTLWEVILRWPRGWNTSMIAFLIHSDFCTTARPSWPLSPVLGTLAFISLTTLQAVISHDSMKLPRYSFKWAVYVLVLSLNTIGSQLYLFQLNIYTMHVPDAFSCSQTSFADTHTGMYIRMLHTHTRMHTCKGNGHRDSLGLQSCW